MAMIFPGMDPYLESPELWSSVHSRLIVYIADSLQPFLRPRYNATIEERVYVEGPDRLITPGVRVHHQRPSAPVAVAVAESDAPVVVRAPPLDVHETYIAILDRHAGGRVVALMEVLSPANKYAGPGRASYLAKQEEILRGPTPLVEIDLLRAGPHVLAVPEYAVRRAAEYDYLVCVSRAQEPRDAFELYPRGLREPYRGCASPWPEATPTWCSTSKPPSPRPTKAVLMATAWITAGLVSRPSPGGPSLGRSTHRRGATGRGRPQRGVS